MKKAWVIYQNSTKTIFAILSENILKEQIEKIAEFLYCYNDDKLTLDEMLYKQILTNASTFKIINPGEESFSVGSESDYLFVKLHNVPIKVNEYNTEEIDIENLRKELFYN